MLATTSTCLRPSLILLALVVFATVAQAEAILYGPSNGGQTQKAAKKKSLRLSQAKSSSGRGTLGSSREKASDPLVPLKIHALQPPGSHHKHGEDVLRSALAWKHEHESEEAYKQTDHDVRKVRVNGPICGQLASQLGALGCSLVTYTSGSPDGCECKMSQSSCPGVPAGFDAVEPSASFTVGSENVILCMYWQYDNKNDVEARAAESAMAKKASVKNAEQLVKDAWYWSKNNAALSSNWMWAVTPTPYPRTPPPSGCDAGEWVANPHNLLHLAYTPLDHGGHEEVSCPVGYSGKYSTQCWNGARTTQCENQITLGMGYVTCCKAGCPAYKKVIVPQTASGNGWGYLYSSSATVDVPKMDSGQVVAVKCPQGWAGFLTYKCLEGTSGVAGACGTLPPSPLPSDKTPEPRTLVFTTTMLR